MVSISPLDHRAVRSQQTVKCNFYYYDFLLFLIPQTQRIPACHLKCELIMKGRRGSQIHRSPFFCRFNENIFCNSCIKNEMKKWILTENGSPRDSEQNPVSSLLCVNNVRCVCVCECVKFPCASQQTAVYSL